MARLRRWWVPRCGSPACPPLNLTHTPPAPYPATPQAVEAGVIVSVALAFLRKSNQMHLKSQGAAWPCTNWRTEGQRSRLGCHSPGAPSVAAALPAALPASASAPGWGGAAPWPPRGAAGDVSLVQGLPGVPSLTPPPRPVFWGAFSGVACAVVLGVVILVAYYRFKSSFFKGPSQLVFEASVMLTACAMITVVSWAMLRMLSMYKKWENRLAEKLEVGGGGLDSYALFLMAFTATFREGIEAVVFITGVSQGNPTSIPIPGVLGLCLGALFSYVVFFSGRHVDITPFMYATSALMFAIGAGLLSRGFNGLQTAGYFGVFDPGVVADYTYSATAYTPDTVPLVPSWINVPLGDFRACCPAAKNSTTFFGLLRSIFGYSDRPTRLEIITYVVYWGYVLLSGLHKWRKGTLFGKTPSLPHKGEGGGELQAVAAPVEVDHGLPGGEEGDDDHVCVEGDLGCACGKYTPARPAGEEGEVKPEEVVATQLAPTTRRGRALALLARAAARARTACRNRYAPVAAFGAIAFGLVLGLPLGLELQPGPPGRPVVDVTLVIARLAAAPQDGWPAVTVNGQYPGPVVRVPLGSTVRATIVNGHPQNGTNPPQGTAVHWHGQSLAGTPWADGVPGLTQCPVPAVAGANTLVVEFTPDRAGTFWYHGHLDSQYPDGLYGAFIVDDGGAALEAAGAQLPADRSPEAEWTWMVADRYRAPVCYPQCAGAPYPNNGLDGTLLGWFLSPESGGVEPIPDSVVVNGAPSGTLSFAASTAGGATKQLVRIINAAALNRYNFSVDGLAMTVVELDGTPVTPFDVPWLVLTIAQRAVVILDWARLHPAVAASPALFLRVTGLPMDTGPGLQRSTAGTLFAGGAAVFDPRWVGTIEFVPGAVPSYGTPPGATVAAAADSNLLQAVSWPPVAAPNATQQVSLTFGFANDSLGVNRGYINNATFRLSPTALAVPILHSFMASSPLQAPTNLTGSLTGDGVNPLVLPFNRVVEVTINNKDIGEHPFHLHGHNFWLVATSDAPGGPGHSFVRRDVVSVPGLGWARIRFVAANPGIWLFHCHIDWHMHAGLATVVVEAPAQVYVRSQTGAYQLPSSHGTACRTWANGATIPGAGAGFVAAGPVLVGPDNS